MITAHREHSLVPVEIERPELDQDLVMLRKSKLLEFTGTLCAAMFCLAGLSLALQRIDSHALYAHAASRFRVLYDSRVDVFLRCALPETDRARVTSTSQLLDAFEAYGDRDGIDYARVLAPCVPLLDGLPSEIAATRVPARLAPRAEALRHAALRLARAAGNYRAELSTATQYDYVRVLPLMEKLALAVAAYEARQADLDSAIRRR